MKSIYLKITLWFLAVIVAIVFIVAAIVSPVVKSYINKHSEELIGRKLHVEKLRINIYTGNLTAIGVDLREKDNMDSFVRFDTLRTGIKLFPLLKNELIVKKFELTGLMVKVLQNESQFNFDDMQQFITEKYLTAESPAEVKEPEEPSKPWAVGIYNIAFRDGTVWYEDLKVGATWNPRDINVEIPGVYFVEGQRTDVGVLLNFARGGSLSTNIKYDVANGEYDLNVVLHNLQMSNLHPYLKDYFRFSEFSGNLSANLNILGDLDHLMDFEVKGDASVTRLHTSVDNREFFDMDSMYVAASRLSLCEDTYSLDKFLMSGARLNFALHNDGTNTLNDVMIEGTSTEPAGQSSTASGQDSKMNVTIKNFEINNSDITFEDENAIKRFVYNITNIKANSRNFDLNGKKNNMAIKANVQKTGTISLFWTGDLSSINNHSITAMCSNIRVIDFTPYSEYYTAYPLAGGNFSIKSQNIIKDGMLKGTNHFDIYRAKVLKKRKDIKAETRIPLKLAIYVLTDKHGHINVDLPVSGNVNSPDFSYRKIVTKAILKFVVKIITAPFSFLTGGKDLTAVAINPLQMDFNNEQYTDFDQLASTILEKPEIKIILTQQFNYDAAVKELSEIMLKLAYFNASRGIEGMRMDMVDMEAAQTVKLSAAEDFANEQCTQKEIDITGLNVSDKAQKLYSDKARQFVVMMAQRRDNQLRTYMKDKHGIPDKNFAVDSLTLEKLQAYQGKKKQYSIAISVDGETVEVGNEEESKAMEEISEK